MDMCAYICIPFINQFELQEHYTWLNSRRGLAFQWAKAREVEKAGLSSSTREAKISEGPCVKEAPRLPRPRGESRFGKAKRKLLQRRGHGELLP